MPRESVGFVSVVAVNGLAVPPAVRRHRLRGAALSDGALASQQIDLPAQAWP
jgi:hypothetical protein